MYGIIAMLVMLMSSPDPVTARWGFDGDDPVGALTYTENACIETLSDSVRAGVICLDDTSGQAMLDSGLQSSDFEDKNWTVSFLFRHDPLPASGTGSDVNMFIFQSNCLTVTIRRGDDGGNAGLVFATLYTDQGSVLFKPSKRVDDGEWHHFLLRADAGQSRIQVFLDGEHYADRDVNGSTSSLFLNNVSTFGMGPGAGTQVDEIHVYNYPLDDIAVLSDYNHALYALYDRPPVSGINSVRVCLLPGQSEQVRQYITMMATHLLKRAPGVWMEIDDRYDKEPATANELVLYAGESGINSVGDAILSEAFGSLPDETNPGAEGYAIQLNPADTGCKAWVGGADERGLLYGLGRLLYLSEIQGSCVHWDSINERSAPEVPLRAMNSGFITSMDPAYIDDTGAREWSEAEGIQIWEESMLNGVNSLLDGKGRILSVSLDSDMADLRKNELSQDYGLRYSCNIAANALGEENMQDGWNAITMIGEEDPHLFCPSVPSARSATLEAWSLWAQAATNKTVDCICLQSGDPGGCYCSDCRDNYAAIFYDLCCDIANTVHQYRPDVKVYFSNQEMQIDQNEVLFSLLRDDSDCPLAGYAYAPGGSENSSYGYILTNPVWEELYPTVDPDSTFLYSRLTYFQDGQEALAMPDVTHWKRAASAVPYPDPVWTETFSRRTYNARPKAYENVFREQSPYCQAGMTGYSEGNFDDFNKYLMLRLMWDSSLSAEDIALEYYTYHCGPDAGPFLVEAVFLGEQILEQPFAASMTNGMEVILNYSDLIESAEAVMSDEYLAGNWRFYQMKQRARIFEYVARRYTDMSAKYASACAVLWAGISNSAPDEAISQALDLLNMSTLPSSVLLSNIWDEAKALDDAINEEIAIRDLALSSIALTRWVPIKEGDFVGVRWLTDQLGVLQQSGDTHAMITGLRDVLNYEKVGAQEFYDDCGTVDGSQPHFDFGSGELYYGTGFWTTNARPSQRWYDYSFDAQPGLKFSYEGLDPQAKYEAAFSWRYPGPLSFSAGGANEFQVYADDALVGTYAPPTTEIVQYTFDMPLAETSDGAVEISFKKMGEDVRYTCVSEIWLRKKKGLVAHWDFHDGTYADQVGSLDGTEHGNVSIVTSGHPGFENAVQFGDSAGMDYLDVGNLGSLDVYSDSFTLSMWIKHETLPSNGTVNPEFWDSRSGSNGSYEGIRGVLRQGDDGDNANRAYISVAGEGGPETLFKGDVIADGEWHWVVIRYDSGSSELAYFEDGVHRVDRDAVAVASLAQLAPRNVRVGDGFGGMIGDVRVYNKALSYYTDENNLLTGGELFDETPAFSGLLAHWSFEDGTFDDQVGSLDGTAFGSVSIIDSENTYFDKAIQVGGSSETDYLDIGDLSLLDVYTNSFTLSMWIKHDALLESDTENPEFWDSLSGNSVTGYEGIIGVLRQGDDGDNANRVYLQAGGGGLSDRSLLKGGIVGDGNWHWLVVRYDESTNELKYFEDGVHRADRDTSHVISLVQAASKEVSIGSGFCGALGDIRIYNRALSYTEDDGNNLTGGELYRMYH